MIMMVIDEDKLLGLCHKHNIKTKAQLARLIGVHQNSLIRWDGKQRRRSYIGTKIINPIVTYFIEQCGEELTPNDLVMFIEVEDK